MPDVIARCCSRVDCITPPILGTEEIHLSDMPCQIGQHYRDHGHLQLWYGQGLLEDLTKVALELGWHWDGTRWLCGECMKAVELVAKSIAV